MPVEKLLLQLRGLQSPIEPGWWPLAIGWWFLLGILALSLLAYVYFWRKRSKQLLFQQASLELRRISNLYFESRGDEQDSRLLLLSLSAWLKQVSIMAFPDKPVGSMTGQAWIEFLDKTMPENNFTQGIGKAFASEIYSPQQVVDSAAILNLCKAWLLSVQPDLLTAVQLKSPPESS